MVMKKGRTDMRPQDAKMERWALVTAYVLLVLSLFAIGLHVENNATESDRHACRVFRAQIAVNAQLVLYVRSINEGVPVAELESTEAGKKAAEELRRYYQEVCDEPLT